MISSGVRFEPGKPPMVPLIPDIDLMSDKVKRFIFYEVQV